MRDARRNFLGNLQAQIYDTYYEHRPIDEKLRELIIGALQDWLVRDNHFIAALEHQPDTIGVLVESAPEALVGDVDERDQPALADHVADPSPLLLVEVRAGRIVTAGMQHDDAFGR